MKASDLFASLSTENLRTRLRRFLSAAKRDARNPEDAAAWAHEADQIRTEIERRKKSPLKAIALLTVFLTAFLCSACDSSSGPPLPTVNTKTTPPPPEPTSPEPTPIAPSCSQLPDVAIKHGTIITPTTTAPTSPVATLRVAGVLDDRCSVPANVYDPSAGTVVGVLYQRVVNGGPPVPEGFQVVVGSLTGLDGSMTDGVLVMVPSPGAKVVSSPAPMTPVLHDVPPIGPEDICGDGRYQVAYGNCPAFCASGRSMEVRTCAGEPGKAFCPFVRGGQVVGAAYDCQPVVGVTCGVCS